MTLHDFMVHDFFMTSSHMKPWNMNTSKEHAFLLPSSASSCKAVLRLGRHFHMDTFSAARFLLLLLFSMSSLHTAQSVMRTVLITGGSRGIGAGLTKAALTDPSTFVIATCRSPSTSNELQALAKEYNEKKLLILPLDTTSADNYKNVVEHLKQKGITTIDVLIANAGITNPEHPADPILTCSEKTMTDVFKTNCVGTMLTLQNFTPLLQRGSTKLCVLLSSRLASIEQAEGVGGYTSYRASKAAMNMLAMTYAEDSTVKEAKIRTLCMHPGWVQTDMGERGGRKASVTIPDCVNGILSMIRRASAVQEEQLNPGHMSPNNGDFETKLRAHGCVFTAYDGEMLPW
jgi:norsolorinic acid ketoreductase